MTPRSGLRWVHRFVVGMLSNDKSLATGLLIALIVWTLTRLVDGVTGSGTIEYDTRYSATTLANGGEGWKVEVTLTNLSDDTALTNLRASISDPSGELVFSDNVEDRSCAFAPPAWGENPVCDPYSSGLTFAAPMLVPGTFARLAIKYTKAEGSSVRPVVRIRPDGTTKFRLVEPGLETFVARYQVELLLGLLGFTFVLFAISVAAGVSKVES